MSVNLNLSSAAGIPGGTVSLNLSISSTGGDQCTDVQWTFSFPPDLTLVSVTIGAAGTAASKSLTQSGNTIIVSGLNSNVIPDGVLATAVFRIAADPSSTSSTVTLGAITASDTNGNALSSTGSPGTVSYPSPPPMCQPAPVPGYTPNLGALQEPIELTGS